LPSTGTSERTRTASTDRAEKFSASHGVEARDRGSDVSSEGASPGRAAAATEGCDVKYMLLIYSSPATWQALTPGEQDQMAREHAALVDELVDAGEYVSGNALADPVRSRTVRVRDDAVTTTDGPYIELKEHLAGYDIVYCDSLERAEAIAARLPEARLGAVEIRPVMDLKVMEM